MDICVKNSNKSYRVIKEYKKQESSDSSNNYKNFSLLQRKYLSQNNLCLL